MTRITFTTRDPKTAWARALAMPPHVYGPDRFCARPGQIVQRVISRPTTLVSPQVHQT
jgi:hypothetical protein